jgi:hypothetical protein
MRYKTLVEIISSLFILLFVYTAVNKWLDHHSFQKTIAQSPLIGSFAAVVAWLLPILELGIAGLLFFEPTRKAGFYAAGSLMFLFTGYIGYMLLSSPHLPCSCGGVLKYLSWRSHLFFNLGWILLAALGLRLIRGNKIKFEQKGVS